MKASRLIRHFPAHAHTYTPTAKKNSENDEKIKSKLSVAKQEISARSNKLQSNAKPREGKEGSEEPKSTPTSTSEQQVASENSTADTSPTDLPSVSPAATLENPRLRKMARIIWLQSMHRVNGRSARTRKTCLESYVIGLKELRKSWHKHRTDIEKELARKSKKWSKHSKSEEMESFNNDESASPGSNVQANTCQTSNGILETATTTSDNKGKDLLEADKRDSQSETDSFLPVVFETQVDQLINTFLTQDNDNVPNSAPSHPGETLESSQTGVRLNSDTSFTENDESGGKENSLREDAYAHPTPVRLQFPAITRSRIFGELSFDEEQTNSESDRSSTTLTSSTDVGENAKSDLEELKKNYLALQEFQAMKDHEPMREQDYSRSRKLMRVVLEGIESQVPDLVLRRRRRDGPGSKLVPKLVIPKLARVMARHTQKQVVLDPSVFELVKDFWQKLVFGKFNFIRSTLPEAREYSIAKPKVDHRVETQTKLPSSDQSAQRYHEDSDHVSELAEHSVDEQYTVNQRNVDIKSIDEEGRCLQANNLHSSDESVELNDFEGPATSKLVNGEEHCAQETDALLVNESGNLAIIEQTTALEAAEQNSHALTIGAPLDHESGKLAITEQATTAEVAGKQESTAQDIGAPPENGFEEVSSTVIRRFPMGPPSTPHSSPRATLLRRRMYNISKQLSSPSQSSPPEDSSSQTSNVQN